MKKIILAVVLTLAAGLVSAQGRGYGYGHQWTGGGNGGNVWVPLILGGTVGYLVSEARRPPVYIQQQPVYIQQPVPVYSVPYTTVPPGYHYENLLDANCNCFRTILVPN